MATSAEKGADYALLLEAAQELARRTGGVALRHFRSALKVESKTDGSPVTVADRKAEQAAREWIVRRFPDDGVLGEEFGAERPAAKRRWLIDPIDGTKTFVRGVPLWGTLIWSTYSGMTDPGSPPLFAFCCWRATEVNSFVFRPFWAGLSQPRAARA